MQTWQIASAQTGNHYGRLEADSEDAALDQYAQARGYADRHDMWDRNQGTHYLTAYAVNA